PSVTSTWRDAVVASTTASKSAGTTKSRNSAMRRRKRSFIKRRAATRTRTARSRIDFSVAQSEDRVEALFVEDEVRDEHDAAPIALGLVGPREERMVRLDVEARVRLVEEHDRRIMQE